MRARQKGNAPVLSNSEHERAFRAVAAEPRQSFPDCNCDFLQKIVAIALRTGIRGCKAPECRAMDRKNAIEEPIEFPSIRSAQIHDVRRRGVSCHRRFHRAVAGCRQAAESGWPHLLLRALVPLDEVTRSGFRSTVFQTATAVRQPATAQPKSPWLLERTPETCLWPLE